jgi:hypothetical protein
MDTPPPSMRELAQRLWAASPCSSDPPSPGAPLVNENLRRSLIQLAGTDGFQSLLRRSIALAGADVPTLRVVNVSSDGRIHGIEQLVANALTAEQAAIAVTTHMLGLLVTFIGEPLTQRLVREACPEASAGDSTQKRGCS